MILHHSLEWCKTERTGSSLTSVVSTQMANQGNLLHSTLKWLPVGPLQLLHWGGRNLALGQTGPGNCPLELFQVPKRAIEQKGIISSSINPSAGNRCWSEEYCGEQLLYTCSILILFPRHQPLAIPKDRTLTKMGSRWNFGFTQKRCCWHCDVSCHYREQLLWSNSFSRKLT